MNAVSPISSAAVPATTCPCCGHVVDRPDPAMFLRSVQLSELQRRMVERLVHSFGAWIGREELADYIWALDANGGPERAGNTISVMKININAKLAGTGFIIEGKLWCGWRLTWRISA